VRWSAWLSWSGRRPARAGARTAKSEAGSVVPFANHTGDSTLDPLGNLAADWITHGLALTGVLEIAAPRRDGAGGRTSAADRLSRAGHEAADVRTLSLGAGRARVSAPCTGATIASSSTRQITDETHGRILHSLEPVLGRAPGAGAPALTGSGSASWPCSPRAVDVRLRDLPVAGQPPRYDAYLAFGPASSLI